MRELLKTHKPLVTLEVGDFDVDGAPGSRSPLEYVSEYGYEPFEFRRGSMQSPTLQDRYGYDDTCSRRSADALTGASEGFVGAVGLTRAHARATPKLLPLHDRNLKERIGIRSISVWARPLGLRRLVFKDVGVGSEGEVIVSAQPVWQDRDSCVCPTPRAEAMTLAKFTRGGGQLHQSHCERQTPLRRAGARWAS